jgi:hypothetical protein
VALSELPLSSFSNTTCKLSIELPIARLRGNVYADTIAFVPYELLIESTRGTSMVRVFWSTSTAVMAREMASILPGAIQVCFAPLSSCQKQPRQVHKEGLLSIQVVHAH